MRIGQGFDAHRYGEPATATEIVLGGVKVAFDKAIVAHSDGDVLIHALCDALLGASAQGDLGSHFPDSDSAFAGADSRHLLRETCRLIDSAGFSISNVDMTLIAQAPRISPFIQEMCNVLAEDMGIEAAQVSIKATTTEGLGFTGRGEGIAAQAVVLLA
jgi:2-C-methyl-D-erythritol 2,4-cyclodiphosphate synthase|tara:strand:+ start:4429 stop:4905 length:477 start_codon:yes stop_codon:yes gene_type:complete